MLGLTKPNSLWNWAAYGKHTAAKDFFRIGQDFPLMRSFSGWVEEGYKNLAPEWRHNRIPNSWRFWAKGVVKETLVCGLLKDSSDNIGRHYPLLIMGTGLLKDWEGYWDILPFACEQTWNQIEYISGQNFSDLKKLEAEIHNIRPPFSGWPELKVKREESMRCECKSDHSSFKSEDFVPLDHETCYDQSTLISHYHYLLMSDDKTIPNVTFMGGTFEKVFLAFFKRPLTTDDFIRLWTVSSAEGT